MSSYVDYAFYVDEWKGSLIDEAAFSNFAIKASAEIDRITFYRIRKIEQVTDEVKVAVCAVIDELLKIEAATSASYGKKSETIGKQSVTYDETLKKSGAGYYGMLRGVASPYLMKTGLLYRGVN